MGRTDSGSVKGLEFVPYGDGENATQRDSDQIGHCHNQKEDQNKDLKGDQDRDQKTDRIIYAIDGEEDEGGCSPLPPPPPSPPPSPVTATICRTKEEEQIEEELKEWHSLGLTTLFLQTLKQSNNTSQLYAIRSSLSTPGFTLVQGKS